MDLPWLEVLDSTMTVPPVPAIRVGTRVRITNAPFIWADATGIVDLYAPDRAKPYRVQLDEPGQPPAAWFEAWELEAL